MSEYEEIRLKNIEDNKEFVRSVLLSQLLLCVFADSSFLSDSLKSC